MKPRTLSEAFSHPGYANFGPSHFLRDLLPTGENDLAAWEGNLRPRLLSAWHELLGSPSFSREDYDPTPLLVEEWYGEDYQAKVYLQPTGPGRRQRLILLIPSRLPNVPVPCAVVPFYHPEQSAGFKPAVKGEPLQLNDAPGWEAEARKIGCHLVRMGFIVACVEAFPFNTVPNPGGGEVFAWWSAAAAKLAVEEPNWTGLGKLVYDTSRALDLLLEQPQADANRVLAMGHSLGGKMAFYTGALDPRVRCVIGSDFGLPWRSSNWDAPWYLGDKVPANDQGCAHHELLALLAPRPFFLIAGNADSRESWQYLHSARDVYRLYSSESLIGGIDHASGHTPSVASYEIAYGWLGEIFGLESRFWRL